MLLWFVVKVAVVTIVIIVVVVVVWISTPKVSAISTASVGYCSSSSPVAIGNGSVGAHQPRAVVGMARKGANVVLVSLTIVTTRRKGDSSDEDSGKMKVEA